jgi:lipoprotein-anchoring transpeptidase ErfK/SrfK
MWKFLPLLLVVAFIALAGTYLPLKREIVYKLGISGDPTTSCCGDPNVIAHSSGNFNENANLAEYDGQIVDYPKTSLADLINDPLPTDTQVLGTTNAQGEEKWIDVNLTEQKVRAYEGNRVVFEFLISSGKWASTPTGTFTIWYKTRFQSMKGGLKELGTYYNLPNVPYNMFFYSGYALHGAYWHNNFGHPMSHGCVNEPIANAKEIFDWAGPVLPASQNAIKASPENPVTRVVVHY